MGEKYEHQAYVWVLPALWPWRKLFKLPELWFPSLSGDINSSQNCYVNQMRLHEKELSMEPGAHGLVINYLSPSCSRLICCYCPLCLAPVTPVLVILAHYTPIPLEHVLSSYITCTLSPLWIWSYHTLSLKCPVLPSPSETLPMPHGPAQMSPLLGSPPFFPLMSMTHFSCVFPVLLVALL